MNRVIIQNQEERKLPTHKTLVESWKANSPYTCNIKGLYCSFSFIRTNEYFMFISNIFGIANTKKSIEMKYSYDEYGKTVKGSHLDKFLKEVSFTIDNLSLEIQKIA